MFTIHNVQQCKHPSFPTMRGQQNSTHFLLAAFVASLKVVWVCDAFAFNHRAGFVPPSPAGNVYSTAVSNVVGPVAFGDRPPVQALHDWRRKGLRRLDASLAKIPSGSDPYAMLRKQTAQATQEAINAGIQLIELEFPPVRGKLDISLAETLDANRFFARELARAFAARMGKTLWLIFPDDAEAAGARKEYGGTTFTVVGIESAIEKLNDEDCQLQIIVNPGFNVDEWIVLDKLKRPGVPMVMLNGNLDKVKMGYYPRIFYPGLFNAKERFLKNFETVYYLKALPGGWIFRQAPGDWQIISASQTGGRGRRATESAVLESSPERPDYNRALKVVQEASKRAQG